MLMSSSAVSCFTLYRMACTAFDITDFLPMATGKSSWTCAENCSTSRRRKMWLKNLIPGNLRHWRTAAPAVGVPWRSSARGHLGGLLASQRGTTAHDGIRHLILPAISVGMPSGRGPNALANRACAMENARARRFSSMQTSQPRRQPYCKHPPAFTFRLVHKHQ